MLWELWRRAQAFNCLPSKLLGINNPTEAFFIDRGIWMFCSGIESEMDEAGNNAKNAKQGSAARYQILMKYLYPGEITGRFRDPAAGASSSGPVATSEDFFAKNPRRKRHSS